MKMSNSEKKTTLAVCRRRYAEFHGKNDKGAFLDEFCALTGLHSKHALRVLNAKPARRTRRRGPPKTYSMDAVRLLTRIWKLADKPCGKLLNGWFYVNMPAGFIPS